MVKRAASQYRYLHPDGTVSRHPALRRRTRLRLAVTRRIDKTCGWLCEHGHDTVAVLIWRACGLWPSSTQATDA
jgi:hypothetical protein